MHLKRLSMPGLLQWVEIPHPEGRHPNREENGDQEEEEVPLPEEEGEDEICRLEREKAAGENILCYQLDPSALTSSFTNFYTPLEREGKSRYLCFRHSRHS